jgi:hypothetical protein
MRSNQRALGHQFDGHLSSEHQPLRLRVEADVAGDRFGDKPCFDKLPDAS